MLKTTFFTISALALTLSATQACADDRGGKGHRMDFATLDANGDGQITAAEIEAQKATRFAEMDTDGNGEISLEEFSAKGSGKSGDHADRHARFFALLDADNSGGLTQAEIESRRNIDRSQMMLAMLDTNGDGQISQEEFEAGKGRGHGGKGWK